MVNSEGAPANTSNVKQLLRMLQFASHRTTQLKSEGDALWLEDLTTSKAKCRISSPALQQGLADGLYTIGRNGLLTLLEPAEQFQKRYRATCEAESFVQQHQEREEALVVLNGAAQRVIRNRNNAPLASLERLKSTDGKAYFTDDLLLAAEMLARDFEAAQLNPRVTSRWEPRLEVGSGAPRNTAQDISDRAANARLRFNKALSAIGPELSGALVDAICFEKGLELIERERGWPVRSGKLMLRTGLEMLARHYQPQRRGSSPMRNWQEAAL